MAQFGEERGAILALRVKSRMRQLRKSQAGLADEAGVPHPVIKQLVAGHFPQRDHFYFIARALSTSPQYLAGHTDDDAQDALSLAFGREELDMLRIISALAPGDRAAVMQLARSLAMGAASARVNERPKPLTLCLNGVDVR